MDLPKIKPEMSFGHDGPPIFGCPELKTSFYRIRSSWAPARKRPGGLALLGEEADRCPDHRKIFILWFQQFNDTGELLSRLQEFVGDYQIQDIYARLTKVEHDFFNFFNYQHDFRQRISVQHPAKAQEDGCIDFHLNLTNALLKPGMQRIFFRRDSNIPQLLQSLTDSETAHEITDIEQPAGASIVYGIASIHYYATYVAPELRYNQKKKYDPWWLLKES